MTSAASNSLPVSTSDEDCACLGGTLYAAVVHAAGYAIFFLSTAWLVQATLSAAPGAVWWKSALALALVLACTWFLRMAWRLNPHARPGWTLFDAAMLLTGVSVTTIFVLRGGPLAGALFLCVFIVQEGSSLWRLKLLPNRLLQFKSGLAAEQTLPNVEPYSVSSLVSQASATAGENTAATILETKIGDDPNIRQQFTRRESEDAVEISGFVRGKFGANQSSTSLDIAFCPTLAGQLTLEVETNCEEEVDVQVATLRPFGARLELKRKGRKFDNEAPFTLEIHVLAGLQDAGVNTAAPLEVGAD